MSWKKETVETPIPKEVLDVASGISSATNSLAGVFSAITTLLEVAKAFYVEEVDPFSSLVNEQINELENLINDTFGTGLSMLVVNPFELTRSSELIVIAEERKRLNKEQDEANAQFKSEQKSVEVQYFNSSKSEGVELDQQLISIKNRQNLKLDSLNKQREMLEQERADLGFDSFGVPILTPKSAIDYAIESFDDLGDANRPMYSDSADIAAIGFLITAPNIDEFIQLLENFVKVFAVPDIEIMLFRLKEVSNTSSVQSSLPDWNSIKLNSFTPMDELQKALVGALETLKGFQITAGSSLDDLISIMQLRTEQLNEISSSLNRLVNAAQSTGLYVLNVPQGSGGVNRVKLELRDKFLECSKNKYTAMVLFVGGGPGATSIDNLAKLFLKSY